MTGVSFHLHPCIDIKVNTANPGHRSGSNCSLHILYPTRPKPATDPVSWKYCLYTVHTASRNYREPKNRKPPPPQGGSMTKNTTL